MGTIDPATRSRRAARPRRAWSWPNFFRNAVLIALGITGSVVLYVKQIQPSLEPLNFGVIAEGKIYRSGRPTPAAMRRASKEFGFQTVIDLGTYPIGSVEQHRLESTYRVLGLDYHRLPLIGDGTGDPNVYARALRLMTDPERQPMLVHCGSGAQRTGGLATLYRNIIEGVGLDEAYAEAERYRHSPRGNPHLKVMLDRWAHDIARVYVEGGLIPYDGPARDHGGRVTQPLSPRTPVTLALPND